MSNEVSGERQRGSTRPEAATIARSSGPGRQRPAEPSLITLPEFEVDDVYVEAMVRGAARTLTFEQHPALDERELYLSGDRELLVALARADFAGPAYTLFSQELVRIGEPLVAELIYDKKITQMCQRRGRPVGAPPVGFRRGEVIALAKRVAREGAALLHRAVLCADRLDLTQDATLFSLYVEACIHSYPAQYREWFLRRLADIKALPPAEAPQGLYPFFLSSANADIEIRFHESLLVALAMSAWGLSADVTANMLGHSKQMIERLLARPHDPVAMTRAYAEEKK